jgi:hypothetical protein
MFLLVASAGLLHAQFVPGDGVELRAPVTAGGPLAAKVVAPRGTDGVVLFYRIEGQTDFLSINLQARPGGTFEGELRGDFPPGAHIQYYADLRTTMGTQHLPQGAPMRFNTLQLPGGAAPTSEPTSVKIEGLELAAPAAKDAPIHGRAAAPPGTEWVVIFYRTVGEGEFNSFNLEAKPDGAFEGDMEAPVPSGTRLECYAALKTPSGIKYLPADAPSKLATLQTPGGKQSPAGGTAGAQGKPGGAVPFPVAVDFSGEDIFHHKMAAEGEQRLLASGQVRFTTRKDDGDTHLILNGRLVYTDQPVNPQDRWSLGELQAIYATGHHKLQAGDQQVQESEFTLAGGGRRGLDYAYAGTQLGAHVFALGTEALPGTRGLVWPVAGNELYGGSLGYTWWNNTVRAKLVFLTGKDDPSIATNLGTSYAPLIRDGSTGALVMDGRFFESRLALSGEYARSLLTRDLVGAAPKEGDQAWRLSSIWTQGPFSAHLGYRDVGRDFGTIGMAFFVGDRRVLDGSIGLSYATWSLSATALDERTNPTGQVGQSQAWNQSQSLDARLALSQTAFWRVGIRQARQEALTVADPLVPFSNSTRTGLTTGFDVMLPPASMLTFNAQYDRIKGSAVPDPMAPPPVPPALPVTAPQTGTSTTLSMGGNLVAGTWLRLSPNLSWTRTLGDPGGEKTTIANAFLNADFTLVPSYLGLLLNGGASRTAVATTGETSTNSTVEGTLRWILDPYFKGRVRASLGLKGSNTRAPILGVTATDNRASLILNVSF